MKNKPIFLFLLALLVLLGSLSLHGVAEEAFDLTALYKNKDVDASWSPSEAEVIDLGALAGNLLTITAKGDYVLSGSFAGQIVVEVPEEDKVRLILNGVSITSPQGPAIYEKQADKLIITLAEGTENILTDGPAITDGDDTIGAALYAEDDLSINGGGSLTVNGTQKHGIQSKADLILADGQLTVTAQTDGIRGRNSVLVLGGKISVTAGGDGITSTRDDQAGKGWIVLAGGNTSILTGEGAGEVKYSGKGGFGGRGGWGGWSSSSTSSASVSQKGVKAATELTVIGGSYSLNCADDGLHAAQVTVNGGSLSLLSGDDGIHADSDLLISGGLIAIDQCYEGLEGTNVTVSGGEISITASDDGINASGGSDQSGFGGRWGNDRFSGGSGGMLTISGGTTYVNAGGDALDSNGSISIQGGLIGLWAATSTGEGAIDFNGSGIVSGGTLIVASTGGVMQDTAQLSGQSMMALSAAGTQSGAIQLLDGSGNELGTFAPSNAFDTVLVSSDQLAEGAACALLVNGQQLYAGAMTGSLNAAGSGYGAFGGFGGGRNMRKGR